MRRTVSIITMTLLTVSVGFGQTLRTVTQLPVTVNETSGVETSDPNKIWTFNDSGGNAELYLCDTSGSLVKTMSISGSWNRDWEDLARDDQGNFYIGNIGNNSNSNTDLTIFKIPNPDLVPGNSVTAEVIYYNYADQVAFPPADPEKNFDCESLFWFNGNLYLCSKNRTVPFDGMTYLYRLPDSAGTYTAQKMGQFDTQGSNMFDYWITAADISPDGSKLALLTSDKMWLFTDFTGDDFFGGSNTQISFPSGTQKEAIAFVDNDRVYITDEDWGSVGRNLYELILPQSAGPYNGSPHIIPGVIQAEEYDFGGSGVGYYDVSAGNQGGQFRNDDVDIEVCSDFGGGHNVGWFEQNDWLQYTVDVQYAGMFDVELRTAGQFAGTAYLEVDQVLTGGTFNIAASGDWQVWHTSLVTSIPLDTGVHTLRLVMQTGGFNFNYLEVKGVITGLEQAQQSRLKVYPNPAYDKMTIYSDRYGSIKIKNQLGELLRAFEFVEELTVGLSEFNPGVYIIEWNDGVESEVARIVKY